VSGTQQEQQTGNRPSRRDRWRDVVTFVGAWFIIGWQMLMVAPADVNETFLVLAATLLGVPFGAEAVARIRGAGGSTTPPEQPSPAPGSSPASPST